MIENSTAPRTIIRPLSNGETNDQCTWSVLKIQEKTLTFKVKNIHLRQEPHETLDLTLYIMTLPSNAPKIRPHQVDYCTAYLLDNSNNPDGFKVLNNIYQYTYKLELNFHNFLHMFNKNYVYEIGFKVPRDESELTDKHFCYLVEPRLGGVIKTNTQISMIVNRTLEDLEKMYFYIRRHKENNGVKNEQGSCNTINELRAVGCDVVLDCRDRRITTHKLILSQKSVVFRKMFTHQMKEEQEGVVDMSNFESKVVLKLLDYLYTGELGNLGDTVEPLFELAHLYQINELCHRCEEYYIFNVKPSNDSIVDILELAKLYDLKELEKHANNFIESHKTELYKSPSYQEYLCQSVNRDNVVNILLNAQKYGIKNIKVRTLNFIKLNYARMINNEQFMDLFESNPKLMKEIYIHIHKKEYEELFI